VKDPLAIGLGGLACGTGFGGGTIVAALVIVRTLEHHVNPSSTQESAADPVLAGTLAGLAVGATFGWHRSRWLDNVWQRGVIGVLSAVGAIICSASRVSPRGAWRASCSAARAAPGPAGEAGTTR